MSNEELKNVLESVNMTLVAIGSVLKIKNGRGKNVSDGRAVQKLKRINRELELQLEEIRLILNP